VSASALNPYADLLSVLANLPVLVREKRRRDGLSLRAAATATGLSFATVHRVESGEDCVLSHARLLIEWVAS
jgi:predicted transcriptional regulator